MAERMRLVFNSAGFAALLNGSEVEQMITEKTNTIADRASSQVPDSEGYRAKTIKAGTRWIGIVGTTDHASVVAESENKVLSKAVIPDG